MMHERILLCLSGFFLTLALVMAACQGYQPVPTISAAYNPQTEDYLGSVGVTYAAPLNLSETDRAIFRGSWSDGAAPDLARLRAENTALRESKARADEHATHQDESEEGVVDVIKGVGGIDWTWPMVGGIFGVVLLVWVWRRKPKK